MFTTRILAGLLLLSLTACTAFRTIRDPAAYLTAHSPHRIRVTTSTQSEVLIEAPTLHGDTLGGLVNGQYEEMAMSNVVLVEARQPAPRRTSLLLVAGVSAAAVAVLVSESGCQGPPPGAGALMVCVNAAETYVIPCPGQCYVKPYPL